jgi:hypothetical protein
VNWTVLRAHLPIAPATFSASHQSALDQVSIEHVEKEKQAQDNEKFDIDLHFKNIFPLTADWRTPGGMFLIKCNKYIYFIVYRKFS